MGSDSRAQIKTLTEASSHQKKHQVQRAVGRSTGRGHSDNAERRSGAE